MAPPVTRWGEGGSGDGSRHTNGHTDWHLPIPSSGHASWGSLPPASARCPSGPSPSQREGRVRHTRPLSTHQSSPGSGLPRDPAPLFSLGLCSARRPTLTPGAGRPARARPTYPVIFGGLRFWYSRSSTVHTAPLTFSTRTKHLCRLRLCRTAFWGGSDRGRCSGGVPGLPLPSPGDQQGRGRERRPGHRGSQCLPRP